MKERENEPVSNLVVEGCEDEEGSQAGGGQRVEGLGGRQASWFLSSLERPGRIGGS